MTPTPSHKSASATSAVAHIYRTIVLIDQNSIASNADKNQPLGRGIQDQPTSPIASDNNSGARVFMEAELLLECVNVSNAPRRY